MINIDSITNVVIFVSIGIVVGIFLGFFKKQKSHDEEMNVLFKIIRKHGININKEVDEINEGVK